MEQVSYKGLGRRKTSVAKVIITPGTGKILINKKTPEEYFPNALVTKDMKQPLEITDNLTKFDINVKVSGGGFNGQAGAIRLGIARALVEANKDCKSVLKKKKMMTRDSRVKERKKYGKYGARRSPQFTKR